MNSSALPALVETPRETVDEPIAIVHAERVLASIEGLAVNSAYAADLAGEIEATASAYVGAAVTELATLRAELFGPQVG